VASSWFFSLRNYKDDARSNKHKFRLKFDKKLLATLSLVGSSSEEIENKPNSSDGLRKFAENVAESSLLGG